MLRKLIIYNSIHGKTDAKTFAKYIGMNEDYVKNQLDQLFIAGSIDRDYTPIGHVYKPIINRTRFN